MELSKSCLEELTKKLLPTMYSNNHDKNSIKILKRDYRAAFKWFVKNTEPLYVDNYGNKFKRYEIEATLQYAIPLIKAFVLASKEH